MAHPTCPMHPPGQGNAGAVFGGAGMLSGSPGANLVRGSGSGELYLWSRGVLLTFWQCVMCAQCKVPCNFEEPVAGARQDTSMYAACRFWHEHCLVGLAWRARCMAQEQRWDEEWVMGCLREGQGTRTRARGTLGSAAPSEGQGEGTRGRRRVRAKRLAVVRSSGDEGDEEEEPVGPRRDKEKWRASPEESDKEQQPPTRWVRLSPASPVAGPSGLGGRAPSPRPSQPVSRAVPGSGKGMVSFRCQLDKAAVRERRLLTRLRETYAEVQRERRARDDMRAERDEVSWAREALEEEVASLRARLEQGDGQVLDQGARAAELQELLGRVEGAQASLVRRRSWLVGSVAAARGEAMRE